MIDLNERQREDLTEQFVELVDNVTNEVFIDVNNNGGKY